MGLDSLDRIVAYHSDKVERVYSKIEKSPTAFHTVASICAYLDEAGFRRLNENDAWSVAPGDACYVTRNNSSIIAFKAGAEIPEDGARFQMAVSHTDSPMLKVKHNPEMDGPQETLRIDVETYGGMIDATWLDRPLGVAGRVMVRTADGRVESRLVASDRDVALIPNVAIHQMREINKGRELNRQIDLAPIFSAGALERGAFNAMIAELAGTEPAAILGKETSSSRRSASTTTSAPSRRSRRSSPRRTRPASPCSAASTTRRSARAPSRAPIPPSCATRSCA